LLALGPGCACGAPNGTLDAGDARLETSVEDALSIPDAADARGSDARDAMLDAPPDVPPDAPLLGPPYPIVLAHGFFGFDDFAGIDFINYFFGVLDDLNEAGETQIYITTVDPFADSTTRGLDLLAQVEAIQRESGYARVNLIGHSQGGLDARVVASMRPDLIASVTTVATPHRGTIVADVVLELVRDDRLQDALDALVRLIGAALYDTVGEETSVFDSLRQLSTDGGDAFNDTYPDVEGLPYYSIAGRSARTTAFRDPCPSGESPDFMDRWNIYTDPLDPLLSVPGAIVTERAFGGEVNDGLVAAASARWGRFLGCIPADHLDQIGHLLGDSPGFGNGFDHLRFYRDLVAFLRAEGF
jgi:triacylglycerol lipase